MEYLFPVPARPLKSLLDSKAARGEEFTESEATLDVMLMADAGKMESERTLSRRWNWSPSRVHRGKEALVKTASEWRCFGVKQTEAEVKQPEANIAQFDAVEADPEAGAKQFEAVAKQPVYIHTRATDTELRTTDNSNPLLPAKPRTERVRAQKKSGFVEPDLDQVREVFTERAARSPGLFDPDLEAEKFHSYYTANGWRVGRNPMKSWQATITNWITNIRDRNGNYHNRPTPSRTDSGRTGGTPVRGGHAVQPGRYDYLVTGRGRSAGMDRRDGAGGDPATVPAGAPAAQLRRVV